MGREEGVYDVTWNGGAAKNRLYPDGIARQNKN